MFFGRGSIVPASLVCKLDSFGVHMLLMRANTVVSRSICEVPSGVPLGF